MATETKKELITTYNGKKIIFYPTSHRYKYEDAKTYLVSPSSVTGILDKSQQLLIWNDNLIKAYAEALETREYQDWEVKKLFEEALQLRVTKLEEAKTVGDIVHDYAERTAWCKTMGEPLPEIPEEAHENDQAMQGIQAFLQFELDENVEYLDAERFIYSESHGVPYVGRFDTIIKVRGMRILTDYKTSKGVYTSQKYQLAGYDLALIEEYAARKEELPYDAIGVLHFDKNTGVPTLHILPEEERVLAQKAFKGLLVVKDIEKQLNVWSK